MYVFRIVNTIYKIIVIYFLFFDFLEDFFKGADIFSSVVKHLFPSTWLSVAVASGFEICIPAIMSCTMLSILKGLKGLAVCCSVSVKWRLWRSV